MPIFKKITKEMLPLSKDRWTPIYLEHGRIEVDDSAVKWVGADHNVFSIPIAMVSVLLIGPGTTITHNAIKSCANSNTPICWIGEDSLHFYSFGFSVNMNSKNAVKHAKLFASRKYNIGIARKMFQYRFPNTDVENKSIKELRGMEGYRVRELYKTLGEKYGVTWKGRNYNSNFSLSDNINKSISYANVCFYSLCCSVICSMGYLPQLGFIHTDGSMPFVYDIADIFKPVVTLPSAFKVVGGNQNFVIKDVITTMKYIIETEKVVKNIVNTINELMV